MALTIGFDTSALDLSFKAHAGRGIGRYVTELVRYLKENPDPTIKFNWFDHRSVRKASLADALINILPAGRQTMRQQLLYPSRLKSVLANADLVHFPAHMDATAWCPKPYLITVLDLIPLVLADLYRAERPGFRFRFARWLEMKAMTHSTFVFAISEHTAKDVERLVGIPRERIMVTPLGVDQDWFSVRRPESPEVLLARLQIPTGRPLVLYVGGIDPRKNWVGIVETFAALKARRAVLSAAPLLVMAGKIQKDDQFPKFQAAVRAQGLEQDIICPGFVSDDDLKSLFGLAAVFFFPSLYEGFGLPPLEAMAAGVPVVSSDRSCMPEILGDAARLVDPQDARACSQAIEECISNQQLAAALRAAGPKRARLFTWERTGQATIEGYRRCAQLLGDLRRAA